MAPLWLQVAPIAFLGASRHHLLMNDDDDFRYPSELAERFQVRLPAGMRDRIKAAAEANNRSMNAEIVATLGKAYPPIDFDHIMLDSLIERYHNTTDEAQKRAILATFQAFLAASGSRAQLSVDDDGEIYLVLSQQT